MRKHATVLALLFCLISNGNMRESSPSSLTIVEATQKTQDVETAGDAADDIAIYVHPKKPSQSLIIGTDKHYGLNIYSLSGEKKQGFPDGEINNVDLRYGFRFKGKTITLIGAGNRTTNTMDFYSIDKDSDAVQRLSIKSLDAGLNIYGSCFYQSPISDKFYFFVNSKKGEVIQWEIFEEKQSLSAKKTRSFNVGSQTEGCVSDDDLKRFYVAEENVGIWSYGAEPSEGEKRKLIDKTGKNGHLMADVEGLALYKIGKNEGYLLASSQGENAFNIYKRSDNGYLGKFFISYQDKLVMNCDGIEATAHYLNLSYPTGMMVVQDGNPNNERQSFKLVPWHKIALGFYPPLLMVPLNS